VQDRGLAAYIAELLGTLVLTFFITSVIVLYVASGQNAQFGSDFAVVGLTHAFVLFALIISIGVASGGHFNPAVTAAFIALRRIDPIDGLVYILAQLSGGVLGALLTKGFLLDEGQATNYGATQPSNLIDSSKLDASLIEGIGTLMLVLTVLAVALNPEIRRWAALAIGSALGFIVMVFGPLTGAAVNPARWFGPALVGNEFAGVWPYVVGPLVGAVLAALIYRFVIEPASGPTQELADEVAPRGPAPPAGEAPPLRQGRGPGGPPPPSSPPGGIVGS
jgi:MIP family channel proteins